MYYAQQDGVTEAVPFFLQLVLPASGRRRVARRDVSQGETRPGRPEPRSCVEGLAGQAPHLCPTFQMQERSRLARGDSLLARQRQCFFIPPVGDQGPDQPARSVLVLRVQLHRQLTDYEETDTLGTVVDRLIAETSNGLADSGPDPGV